MSYNFTSIDISSFAHMWRATSSDLSCCPANFADICTYTKMQIYTITNMHNYTYVQICVNKYVNQNVSQGCKAEMVGRVALGQEGLQQLHSEDCALLFSSLDVTFLDHPDSP